MKRWTLQRLLILIGGSSLILASGGFVTVAVMQWAQLETPQRISMLATAVSVAAIGLVLTVLARPVVITFRTLKRLFILLMGSTVMLIGVALLVLPGPGWVVIFAGLGILGTEFVFARRLLKRARETADSAAKTIGLSARLRRRLHLSPSPPDSTKSGRESGRVA